MRPIALALVLVALVGGCSDDDPATSSGPGTTATPTADHATGSDGTATDASAAGTRLEVGELLTERYCEVLTVTGTAETEMQAEVWGSQGINDCPQEGFDRIDADAAAEQVGAVVAVVNGPRFWLLDAISAKASAGSGETRTFGGVEMRSIAVVDLDPSFASREPYAEVSVRRDTAFFFDAGTEIHELTAPDGSIYVMQSFTVEVDPELDRDRLAGLADRLDLPEGWTFASRVLDEELAVEDIEGIATVVQDELHNTYQLRHRG